MPAEKLGSMKCTSTQKVLPANGANPRFEVTYNVNHERQAIADSWPKSIDDSAARREWGWEPDFSFEELVRDMYLNLSDKLQP